MEECERPRPSQGREAQDEQRGRESRGHARGHARGRARGRRGPEKAIAQKHFRTLPRRRPSAAAASHPVHPNAGRSCFVRAPSFAEGKAKESSSRMFSRSRRQAPAKPWPSPGAAARHFGVGKSRRKPEPARARQKWSGSRGGKPYDDVSGSGLHFCHWPLKSCCRVSLWRRVVPCPAWPAPGRPSPSPPPPRAGRHKLHRQRVFSLAPPPPRPYHCRALPLTP